MDPNMVDFMLLYGAFLRKHNTDFQILLGHTNNAITIYEHVHSTEEEL